MTLDIRTATEADLPAVAAIHVASWQDGFRGIVPDDFLDSLTVVGSLKVWRTNFNSCPRNITVAVAAAGDVHGFCCAGPVSGSEPEPYPFRIFALHVRPDRRRVGVGAMLLRQALRRAFECERLNAAILWTFEANHRARRFYEREGGALIKSGSWRTGDIVLPEVAYGWQAHDHRHLPDSAGAGRPGASTGSD